MHPRIHRFIRFSSLLVTAVSLGYVAQRTNVRADVTEEGLSQITKPTQALIASISPERPVVIHAYVSKEVPREYVAVRSQLLSILREMQARGGAGLTVRIVEPEPYSPEAQEAVDNYGISPSPVTSREAGRVQQMQLFLGVAFVSGPHEEVVPFLDRGLSPEYEIVRALRTVTQEKKKVVGVLRTDATIMGNFDLQARRQQPAWRVIAELKKQYEVRSLNPGAEIPADVDVLLVPQLSSTTTPQLEFIQKYIDAGRPALLTVDPMPLFDMSLSPSEPMKPPPGQQQNMFGPPPPGEPKGDFRGFLSKLGVDWDPEKIVFDTDNPHPSFAGTPPHVIFVGKRPDGTDPFAGEDPIAAGLSEVVVLFGGELKPSAGHEAEFVPLLRTGTRGGFNKFDDMVERHMLFGLQGPVLPRQRTMLAESQVLAAHVTAGETSGEGASKGKNVVVVADLDLFGDQFFVLNERGGDLDGDGVDDIRFDNVTFLLNAIDALSGDAGLVELRGRKSKYRRLSKVDDLTKAASDKRNEEVASASAKAEADIKAAQDALDAAVKKINDDTSLDETTKAVLLKSAEEAENRRLNAKRELIMRDKVRAMERTESEHLAEVRKVEDWIRVLAVLVPPVPAILLGFFIFMRKRQREQDAIPSSRKRGAK
ncbi:Gldg family protein [Nannocystis sp.]|uniref:Gldg family protein n=1 Tax=Nannocystis sp. TaxID=1962667 RepID=UPI002429CC15|nr:Gldg family protein [Nannocystis sp.]MBK7823948.1 Gldg family protein [Nannocystis sp.]MBK9754959.1 Gldg family protein [Nannocystis sp.]